MVEFITIYGLVSTRNLKEVKYVGATKQSLKCRLYAHIKECKKSISKKSIWITSEKNKGYTIKIIAIDITDRKNAASLEKQWIDKYNSMGYNLTNSTKGGEIYNTSSGRVPVVLLTKSGNFYKEFDSISETCLFFNTNRKSIENVLYKKCKTCKGFQIIYKRDYNKLNNYNLLKPLKRILTKEERNSAWKLNSLKAAEKNSIAIGAFDENGNLIYRFKNVMAAHNSEYGFNKTGIIKVLRGERNTHKSYFWKKLIN